MSSKLMDELNENLTPNPSPKGEGEAGAGSVVYMRLEDIQPHPRQGEVYETEVDPEFLASIGQYGILTPLHVVEGGIFSPIVNEYVIISGHRRYKAAEIKGMKVVPVIIKHDIKNEKDAFSHLLISNIQREKNNRERLAEYEAYKQILSQIKQVKGEINIYEDEIFQNEYVVRYLTRLQNGEENDEPLLWRDIIKAATGFSKYEQDMLHQLSDEYCGKTLNRIRKNVKLESAEETGIFNKWQDVRERFRKGKLTLYAAVKEIEDYVNELLEQYKPKKVSRKSKVKEESKEDGFDETNLLIESKLEKQVKFASAGSTRSVEWGYLYNQNASMIQEEVMNTVAKALVGLTLKKDKKYYRLSINELAKLLD